MSNRSKWDRFVPFLCCPEEKAFTKWSGRLLFNNQMGRNLIHQTLDNKYIKIISICIFSSGWKVGQNLEKPSLIINQEIGSANAYLVVWGPVVCDSNRDTPKNPNN